MSSRRTVQVKTQNELNDALKRGDYPECVESGVFEIYGSAQVTAYGSAQVTAYGSAQVTAYGSAQVRASGSAQVRAYGSAQVRAYGSAQVRASGSAQVRAYGSAQVTAYGSAQVTALKFNAVTIHGKQVKAKGGVQIKIREIATAKEWCDFYGIEIKKGVVVLFKAIDDDYSTSNARPKGIFYKPGEKPVAPDWDGGKEECGGGLHFSPSPHHALEFNQEAKRFVACPLKVSEIKVHKNASMPQKVKAPGLCAPCFEVTINGEKVA